MPISISKKYLVTGSDRHNYSLTLYNAVGSKAVYM